MAGVRGCKTVFTEPWTLGKGKGNAGLGVRRCSPVEAIAVVGVREVDVYSTRDMSLSALRSLLLPKHHNQTPMAIPVLVC